MPVQIEQCSRGAVIRGKSNLWLGFRYQDNPLPPSGAGKSLDIEFEDGSRAHSINPVSQDVKKVVVGSIYASGSKASRFLRQMATKSTSRIRCRGRRWWDGFSQHDPQTQVTACSQWHPRLSSMPSSTPHTAPSARFARMRRGKTRTLGCNEANVPNPRPKASGSWFRRRARKHHRVAPRPGAETGWHRHAHTYVVVCLTSGQLLAETADGTSDGLQLGQQ